MKRYFLLFILFAAALVACNKSEPAPIAAAPSPTPLPSQAAIVAAPAMGSAPSGASSPVVKNAAPILPGQKGKDGKVAEQPLPPAIWDRMTKPLSDEDIKKLPPETRDMILRAQGKLPPAASPKK